MKGKKEKNQKEENKKEDRSPGIVCLLELSKCVTAYSSCTEALYDFGRLVLQEMRLQDDERIACLEYICYISTIWPCEIGNITTYRKQYLLHQRVDTSDNKEFVVAGDECH